MSDSLFRCSSFCPQWTATHSPVGVEPSHSFWLPAWNFAGFPRRLNRLCPCAMAAACVRSKRHGATGVSLWRRCAAAAGACARRGAGRGADGRGAYEGLLHCQRPQANWRRGHAEGSGLRLRLAAPLCSHGDSDGQQTHHRQSQSLALLALVDLEYRIDLKGSNNRSIHGRRFRIDCRQIEISFRRRPLARLPAKKKTATTSQSTYNQPSATCQR